tara:strand:+ start:297 stop:710 length:414 start_codon:yes stop_codon:yes gene_type:complete
MANGTIAFDTLSTSDAKKSGTIKSLDTSYIHNGVVKTWINGTTSTTTTDHNSINIASIVDNGTGDTGLNFTNSFANVTYVCVGAATNGNKIMGTDMQGSSGASGEHETGHLDCNIFNLGDQARVDSPFNIGIIGDLA